MRDKCKCCGVVLRLESENEDGNYLQVDGSYHTPWRCRDELARQLAAMTKDRDELAAAIATPEVYAEVVTRVLEEQLATAIAEQLRLEQIIVDSSINYDRELAAVRAERDEAVDACRMIYGLRFTGHVVGEVIEAVRAVVAKANAREGAKP